MSSESWPFSYAVYNWTPPSSWRTSLLKTEHCVLGSCYCRKSKYKGGAYIFVHNSIKFTSKDIDNYSLDQNYEACAIHLNSKHDKLCILATYRSPRGNFNNATKITGLQNSVKLSFLNFLWDGQH